MQGHTWNEDVGHSRTQWTERLFEICKDVDALHPYIRNHWVDESGRCMALTIEGNAIVLPQVFVRLVLSMPGNLLNRDIVVNLLAYIERRERDGNVSRQHQEDP